MFRWIFLFIFIISPMEMFSEKYFDYIKRFELVLSYEDYSLKKISLFDDSEIPGRNVTTTFKTVGLGASVYLPVYWFDDDFTIGFDPEVKIIMAGKRTFTKEIGGISYNQNYLDEDLPFAGMSFSAFLQTKWGSDASFRKLNSKFGFGIGLGVVKNSWFTIDYSFTQLAVNGEFSYMFKKKSGITLRATIPISTFGNTDLRIFNYAITIGAIGWFL